MVYRQPDDIVGGHRSTRVEFRQALSKLEETLSSAKNPMPDVLLCGDFNLSHAVWEEERSGKGATTDEQVMIEELLVLSNEFFLCQLIKKPTHRKGNTLDLLFSNNPMILHSYNIMDTVLSDHEIIECLTTCSVESTENEQPANLNAQQLILTISTFLVKTLTG